MLKIEKYILAIFIILSLSFFIFSYSFVNLELTLSQNQLILWAIEWLQLNIYTNRALTTSIYSILLSISFALFGLCLYLSWKNKLSKRFLIISTSATTLILMFAYPFLSADLFNYMFDAKVVVVYKVSPYTHKALDFPSDDWLRFMNWTHRTTPYGPLWIAFTLIPAFLGFGKFLLMFFMFKMFIGFFHLVNAFLIYKILNKIHNSKAIFGTFFYALNPTLLLEGIANSHNDIVMATFIIATIYFFIFKRTYLMYLSLFCGVLIKYVPLLILPWILWISLTKKKNANRFILLNIISMALFTYVYSTYKIAVPFVSPDSVQAQFQTWYLFWSLPLVAMTANIYLIAIGLLLSFGASLRYLPFMGDYGPLKTVEYMQAVTVLPPVIGIVSVIFMRLMKKISAK